MKQKLKPKGLKTNKNFTKTGNDDNQQKVRVPRLVTAVLHRLMIVPFFTVCASCSAVYCNRSCLWVGGCVATI